MGWADKYIERLNQGLETKLRPRGRSMEPRIKSGQLVTLIPVVEMLNSYPNFFKVGDIVLCEVKGKQFLHLIVEVKIRMSIDEMETTYLIGNMKGFNNGWIRSNSIYGKAVSIE